jgi:hypothetical protein
MTEHLEARRVDDDVARNCRGPGIQLELEPGLTSRDRCIVRNWELDAHQSNDRLEESLRASEAEVEDSLEDERSLDRGIGVDPGPSATGPRGTLAAPGLDSTLINPEGQGTPLDESPVVLGPVPNPVAEGEV